MALTFDAHPPQAGSAAAVNPAKLRDEIHRLSQRLVRSQETYNQDFLSGDPEVPLEEQSAVIESYRARLDVATELLRQHETGYGSRRRGARAAVAERGPAAGPAGGAAAGEGRGSGAPSPAARGTGTSCTAAPAPAPAGPRITGPGIANPDGTPLFGDGGIVLRSEDIAVGEYVRHAADLRWATATGRWSGDELQVVCDAILAALAHKHGVSLEDERQVLDRQVNARYRRDYG